MRYCHATKFAFLQTILAHSKQNFKHMRDRNSERILVNTRSVAAVYVNE